MLIIEPQSRLPLLLLQRSAVQSYPSRTSVLSRMMRFSWWSAAISSRPRHRNIPQAWLFRVSPSQNLKHARAVPCLHLPPQQHMWFEFYTQKIITPVQNNFAAHRIGKNLHRKKKKEQLQAPKLQTVIVQSSVIASLFQDVFLFSKFFILCVLHAFWEQTNSTIKPLMMILYRRTKLKVEQSSCNIRKKH